MDRTRPDVEWLVEDEHGNVPTWERVGVAVLMDIRRELRRIRSVLECSNTQQIPSILRRISVNTAKPRKRRKGRA